MIFIEIPCEIACQSQFKILDFFPSGGYGKAAKHMGKQFIEMLNMLIEPEFYVNWSYASWWYCVEDNFCFYYLRGNYFSISIIILVVSHDFFLGETNSPLSFIYESLEKSIRCLTEKTFNRSKIQNSKIIFLMNDIPDLVKK